MSYLHMAKKVLEEEANAISRSMELLPEDKIERLVTLYEKLMKDGGQLVFSGVGKSGIIAKKLASTFSSLGQRSFFLHPVEAMHGDLGGLRSNDILLFISKSGATEELLKLFPYLPLPKDSIIGLVGKTDSPLAEKAGLVFDCSVEKEACLHNQAPTTSSTVALAMGDALAVVYENVTGLSKENFAINHPGGPLGKALRLQVKDLMIPKDNCPTLSLKSDLKEAVLKLTEYPVGLCAILDQDELAGIIVDGDIRRSFGATKSGQEAEILSGPIHNIMNKSPIAIGKNEMAYKALELMEKRKGQITVLPVLEGKKFLGVIRLHDLIREGLL